MHKKRKLNFCRSIYLFAFLCCFSTGSVFSQDDLPPGISPKGEATDFVGHVARINATDKFVDAYGKLDDDHPVIHLNLLRWRPSHDGTLYGLYGNVAGGEIAAIGGSTVHVASASQMPPHSAFLVL